MPNYERSAFNPPAPMAQVILRNLESGAVWTDVPMLIDTGADITMIPQSALGLLELALLPGRQHKLQGFDDSESYSPVVRVELTFCSRNFRGEFLLIDQSWGVISRNVLNSVSLIFDGPNLIWDEYRPAK